MATEAAIYMFQLWESESHRENAFDLRGDKTWLTGDADVGYLDVVSLLSKYGDLDFDSGPVDAWLHTIGQALSEDVIFEPCEQVVEQFPCERCLTHWAIFC
jgi:hypothetical protein